MALPTAAEFFLPEPNADLSQGDIVLAPTTVLYSEKTRAPIFMFGAAPEMGDPVTIALWDEYGAEGTPITVAEVVWGPAMILSHSCELDKEFNREVDRLIRDEGKSEEEARGIASTRDDLDLNVVLSPLLKYEAIPTLLHDSIRHAERVGYFPVPAAPQFDDEEHFIDLSRVCTVDRRLIRRYRTLTSLTDAGASVFRFKIAEAFATRRLATVAELEAAVGHRIEKIDVVDKSKSKTVLTLHLDNGEALQLEIRQPKQSLGESITRIIPDQLLPERFRHAKEEESPDRQV